MVTPSGSSNASVYLIIDACIDTKIPSQCKWIFDENKIRALDNHQEIEILIYVSNTNLPNYILPVISSESVL